MLDDDDDFQNFFYCSVVVVFVCLLTKCYFLLNSFRSLLFFPHRQDIHRKLLDTSLYAAILRFVCHGRDMSELSIVIDRVAGNVATTRGQSSTATMFTNNDEEGTLRSSPSNGKAPFVATNRRNTLIGQQKPNSRRSTTNHHGNNAQGKKTKKKKSGITKKNSIQVRHALRKRNEGELRQLMRQSDQRGTATQFSMTLDEVRTSIEQKERGGRGIVTEEVGGGGSRVTKSMIKSIKSPALKRRLLRHV